ncbi:MAG TPA: hypothetical protein VEV61_03145 [Streptosporangiaceae bacterium]|nr:hypothetical protein [Streptosporangiaceae bacterium]
MDAEDATALMDLQMHWDEAYVISLNGETWWARFRGSADDLLADTCDELRDLIRTDYANRQRARAVNGEISPLPGERMST